MTMELRSCLDMIHVRDLLAIAKFLVFCLVCGRQSWLRVSVAYFSHFVSYFSSSATAKRMLHAERLGKKSMINYCWGQRSSQR